MPRKSYTIKEKLEALKLSQENINISTTAQFKGLLTKMLRDWKCKDDVFLQASDKTNKRHIGSGRKPFCGEIETKLLD